jgi:hypothetical protein
LIPGFFVLSRGGRLHSLLIALMRWWVGAAVLTILLQVSNSVYLHAFWPLVVALSFNLLLAFRNFVTLLYSEFRTA